MQTRILALKFTSCQLDSNLCLESSILDPFVNRGKKVFGTESLYVDLTVDQAGLSNSQISTYPCLLLLELKASVTTLAETCFETDV